MTNETDQLKPTLWVMEDEPSSVFVYQEILRPRFETKYFDRVRSFQEALQSDDPRPDLVLADLRLKDGMFLEHLNQVVEEHKDLRFIVISCIDDEETVRACFSENQVFDYMTKPFSKSELLVKIERVLSEASEQSELTIDWAKMAINWSGKRVQLTAKELQIFSVLLESKKKPVERTNIISKVWGGVRVGEKTLDVHIFNLRKKVRGLDLDITYVPDNCYQVKLPDNWQCC